jgi:pimeloyl-ACP methyl ester carboxylesterase
MYATIMQSIRFVSHVGLALPRIIAIVIVASIAASSTLLSQQGTSMSSATSAPTRSGHVQANGVKYYYEIQGTGEPLLLLHGGLGSIDMFKPILPMFTAERQVIAVDLHGHGRTELGDRPISLIDIGNDMAVVLEKLGFEKVDVCGYSFGGGVALRLAIQHPALVRRLAIVSAGFSRDGFYPEMLPMQAQVGAAMFEQMKATPMYQSYAAIAPHPEDFPRLLDRMGELMRKPFDWSEEVKTLKMPVMLVFGDADMYRLEHVIEFYRLLGGGEKDAGWMRENLSQNRLAILPDVTHYEMFFNPKLATTILPFLNGTSGASTWAEQAGTTKATE